MDFFDELMYYITHSELSVSRWNDFIRFLDKHKKEVLDISDTYKKRIFEKLEIYRKYYSTPQDQIRRENINPKVYQLLEPTENVEGHKLANVHLAIQLAD